MNSTLSDMGHWQILQFCMQKRETFRADYVPITLPLILPATIHWTQMCTHFSFIPANFI